MRLIDADALYYKVKCECNPYGKPTIDFESGKKVLDWIEKAPTISIPVAELDTTVYFAEWIDVNGDGSIMKCSKCGEEVCCKNNNFCPNCGADMRKEGEAE